MLQRTTSSADRDWERKYRVGSRSWRTLTWPRASRWIRNYRDPAALSELIDTLRVSIRKHGK